MTTSETKPEPYTYESECAQALFDLVVEPIRRGYLCPTVKLWQVAGDGYNDLMHDVIKFTLEANRAGQGVAFDFSKMRVSDVTRTNELIEQIQEELKDDLQ